MIEQGLQALVFGMAGIFTVMGIIIVTVMVLNRFNMEKKEKE